jgi:hypothetical protein
MITDYLPIVAPVIAILNGAIAVFISHFKPEERRTKIVLLSVAILLGGGAAGATIYGQSLTLQKQMNEAKERSEIRERLGGFIARAEFLLGVLRDPSKNAPYDEIRTWITEVEDYLKQLGPGYVDRFRSSVGLLHGMPPGIDQQRGGAWNAIYERSTRLQQFSSELGR